MFLLLSFLFCCCVCCLYCRLLICFQLCYVGVQCSEKCRHDNDVWCKRRIVMNIKTSKCDHTEERQGWGEGELNFGIQIDKK